MVRKISLKRIVLLIGLLALAAAACNLQNATPIPSRPPTLAPTVTETAVPPEATRTLIAPETVPAAVPPTFTPANTFTPLPTFTPFVPTLAPTITPSQTAQPQISPTLRATSVIRITSTITSVISGPLDFTFEISWRLSSENPMEGTATVTIYPTGGSGDYTYLRDNLPTGGNPFEYSWVLCKGNPGTLTVESADGQSVSQSYFERPPCPTPTSPAP